MKRSTRRGLLLVRVLRPAVHIVCILFSFWLIYLLRQQTDLIPFVQLRIPEIDLIETSWFALLASVLFVLVGTSFGIYELFKPIHNYYKKFLQTWAVWLITSSFVAYMGFGFLFTSGISRFILLVGGLLALLVITIVDMWRNSINAYLERRQPYCMILYGTVGSSLMQHVKSSLELYDIYQVELVDTSEPLPSMKNYDILLAVGGYDKHRLQAFADAARVSGATFYHIGDTLFLEDLISLPQRVGPIMAMEYKPSPLDGRRRVIKRLFDLFLSLLALLILSPVFLLVAIAIKLDSAGPVLYRQKRIGKNKHPFTFIKFRSMYTHLSVGEDYGGKKAAQVYEELIASDANTREGILPKIDHDPRVTRVGRFLRKTSLDELPSLWSVLIGDMSLVGPRPHLPNEVDQYDTWQERLFSVKPGITGHAQLFGRDKLPFEEEAKLDLYYIQNWSVLLDVYVLVSTVKVLFSGR